MCTGVCVSVLLSCTCSAEGLADVSPCWARDYCNFLRVLKTLQGNRKVSRKRKTGEVSDVVRALTAVLPFFLFPPPFSAYFFLTRQHPFSLPSFQALSSQLSTGDILKTLMFGLKIAHDVVYLCKTSLSLMWDLTFESCCSQGLQKTVQALLLWCHQGCRFCFRRFCWSLCNSIALQLCNFDLISTSPALKFCVGEVTCLQQGHIETNNR